MQSEPLILPASQANPLLLAEVEVRNLTVFIGEYRALKDISFALYRNRVTAIIGPSGCGKSVLLKTMVGLLAEEVADVTITGEVVFEGEKRYCRGDADNRDQEQNDLS
jgi:phosphate transport system ATP-binding protein